MVRTLVCVNAALGFQASPKTGLLNQDLPDCHV
jgi:hypothetical protein